jgi:ferrous iron transport protein A
VQRAETLHTLDAAAVGSRVRLAEVQVEGRSRLRLAELGLRCGAVVRIVSRSVGGGRVVAVDGARIALDRGTAGRLTIAPA